MTRPGKCCGPSNRHITNVEGYYIDDHFDDEIQDPTPPTAPVSYLRGDVRKGKKHKPDLKHRVAPDSSTNPNPDYYNCECAFCHKPLHRSPTEVRQSPSGRFFCNPQEQKMWRRANGNWDQPTKTRNRGIALKWKGVVYA